MAGCLAAEVNLKEPVEEHLFKCMNGQTPLVSSRQQLQSFTDTTTRPPPGPVPAIKSGPADIFSVLNPGALGNGNPAGGLDFFSSFLGGGQGGSNPLLDLFSGGGGGGDFLSKFTGGLNPASIVPTAPAMGGGTDFLGGGGGGGGGAANIFSSFLERKKRATDQSSVFHEMMMLSYTNELVDELCPNSRGTVAQCIDSVSEGNIQMEYLHPAFTREAYCDYRLKNNCLFCRHKRAADAEAEATKKFCNCFDKMREIVQNRCGDIQDVQECEDLKSGATSNGNSGRQSGSGGSSANRDQYNHLEKDDVCSSQYVMPTVQEILG